MADDKLKQDKNELRQIVYQSDEESEKLPREVKKPQIHQGNVGHLNKEVREEIAIEAPQTTDD